MKALKVLLGHFLDVLKAANMPNCAAAGFWLFCYSIFSRASLTEKL
jgi:hypothetical protein